MIAWDPQFAWRYESRWALLQKLSWLNSVRPAAFRRGTWALPERDAPQRTLEEALDARAPEHVLGYGWRDFAWNVPLRLCEQCSRVGYHSAVQQIDGLAYCPWHRCPLRSQCPRCGGRLDDHTQDAFVGFRCPKCGQSLLDEDVLPTVTGAMIAHEEATIGAVARWIRTLPREAAPILHRNREAEEEGPWLRCSLSEDAEGVSYATATPRFLNEAVAFPLDTALLAPRPLGLYAIRRNPVAVSDIRADTTRSANIIRYPDLVREVDRLILSRIKKQHAECLTDAAFLCHEARLHPTLLFRLCPVAYGYTLWRDRAEQWANQMRWPYSGMENCLTKYSAVIERRALLNSFYAGVQSATVTIARIANKMAAPKDAPVMTSPWVRDSYERARYRSDAPLVQIVLEDRDVLSSARCDHGRARRIWTRVVDERFERLYRAIQAVDAGADRR